ncbi:hypothetical protein LHYA1_G004427 [Lachnellula hyalina]|uniref:Uncharacterized protein n=1 Tax=Lachnellula hyalina TaxID=1316788 RepID=A0A8H8R390_9HELO|nr:uncharacterized protein LHYA1_G004427 [Lachnellula hyalina]TVY26856.1 hypothetical protein LHYA1_G004427 [Lachnellula hyalina]
MESIRYIVRSLSTRKPDDKVLYVLSFARIILAPVLMAAACYYCIFALLLQMICAIKVTSINPSDADAVSKANKGKRMAEIGVVVQLEAGQFYKIF